MMNMPALTQGMNALFWDVSGWSQDARSTQIFMDTLPEAFRCFAESLQELETLKKQQNGNIVLTKLAEHFVAI
jgi:hypothetical protein